MAENFIADLQDSSLKPVAHRMGALLDGNLDLLALIEKSEENEKCRAKYFQGTLSHQKMSDGNSYRL